MVYFGCCIIYDKPWMPLVYPLKQQGTKSKTKNRFSETKPNYS